jgi:hypothetical protein
MNPLSTIELGPKARAHPFVRFGLAGVLLLVVTLLAAAAMTPYHNVSSAPFYPSDLHPRASTAGRVHLKVHDGDLVRAGQELAEVEPLGEEIAGTITLPPDAVAAMKPPCAAFLSVNDRKVAVTITSVSPAAGGSLDVRLLVKGGLPPSARTTLSIPGPKIPLLRQLLRRTTS